MTAETRRYFEDRAPAWDDRMPPDLESELITFAAPFADQWHAAQAILEIGTGTGNFIPTIKHYAPTARLISLDLAYGMLHRAKRRVSAAGLLQASVFHIPLAHQSVDLVLCHNSFPHFADYAGALRKIAKVLKQGGQLMILHHHSREFINNIHINAGAPINSHLLPAADAMQELLKAAGYTGINIEDTSTHYVARARLSSTR